MTEHPLFLCIDASTTSVRVTVLDLVGEELAAGRAPIAYERVGRSGYEQDAETWWSATERATQEAVFALTEARRADIVALSITHQRETVVVTDQAGRPLAPALLWMDGRATEDVAKAERLLGGVRLHNLTGKPPCTSPSLYKLMYLFRQRPELRAAAYVHDVHSFLTLRLTGRAVSSLASADASGLVDIRKRGWSSLLVQLAGVDADRLPELVDAGYFIGPIRGAFAEATGLPRHVVVYAGAGDGQAACLGAGILAKGRAFVDLGTSINAGVVTEGYHTDRAVRTLLAAVPGKYCLETTLRGGMLTLSWLKETILGETDKVLARKRLESEAAELHPGSDGLISLPYWSGVMTPYWNDEARGALIGLGPTHSPAHVYRALLEGIACEVRLHLEGIESATSSAIREIVLLGGGSRSELWCQILADVLGRPVIRSSTADAAALGVAILSAVSHGLFTSFEHATLEMVHPGDRFVPGASAPIYERLYRDAYRGLYAALVTRLGVLASVREAAGGTTGEEAPGRLDDES